ncbi:MAG: hypothetical protein M3259_12295 [Actinomycetota bacterium]|nr:hypothetical protein [Actinomycetota bacterium]
MSNRTRVTGGIVSGNGHRRRARGTALALICQNREGQEIRATVAVAFAMGTAISLLVLALAERVGLDHLLLALELLLALLLGLWGAGFFARLLSGRWLRPALLLFAAVSGFAALLLGIAG